MRRGMARDPEKATQKRRGGAPPWTGWAALGVLVAGLAALVLWSLPKGGTPEATTPPTDAGDEFEPWHDEALVNGHGAGGSESPKPARRDTLERPAEASCDLAVVVAPREDLEARIAPEAIAKLLDVRHCGAACDAVKKNVLDEAHVDIDRLTTEELVLPPKDTWDVVGASLTTDERASLDSRTTAIVVHTHGPGAPDHLPVRTCLAVTSVLAETLSGLVWDETTRRLLAPRDLLKQAITAPLGQPVLTPRHLVVQLYRQEDGTARMLSLGMARFGGPDLAVRGAAMADAETLALVIDAVAAKVAAGASALPISVSLDDVAKVTGVPTRDLSAEPARSQPAVLEAIEPARTEGDPDNELAELVPKGGVSGEAWASVLGGLLRRAPQVSYAAFDAELTGIATRSRRELPEVVKRFERGAGRLFLKGPFAAPGADAGAEWMWIEVRRCDARACTGPLTNTPALATNLAEGKPAAVQRAEVADWLLRLPDGGAEGGESIRALERRAPTSK